jgi:hypothetical protein
MASRRLIAIFYPEPDMQMSVPLVSYQCLPCCSGSYHRHTLNRIGANGRAGSDRRASWVKVATRVPLRLSCALCVHHEVKSDTSVCNFDQFEVYTFLVYLIEETR